MGSALLAATWSPHDPACGMVGWENAGRSPGTGDTAVPRKADVAALYTSNMPSVPHLLSRQNPTIKLFRQAFKSGLVPLESERGAEFLAIEGARMLGEAVRSSLRVEKVLFSTIGEEQHGKRLRPQFSRHTEVFVTDPATFKACTEVENPQGVAALVRWPRPKLDDLFAGLVPPLILAAAGLQDPGNLGTLIRAADAFGATGVVALTETVSPFNAKAVRASAGSLFHLPVIAQVHPQELIDLCQLHEVTLIATAARGKTELGEAELNRAVCILIGQEGSGVPRDLLRSADTTVAVPMVREVESLNAGVAGSVILYEAARQRQQGGGA